MGWPSIIELLAAFRDVDSHPFIQRQSKHVFIQSKRSAKFIQPLIASGSALKSIMHFDFLEHQSNQLGIC